MLPEARTELAAAQAATPKSTANSMTRRPVVLIEGSNSCMSERWYPLEAERRTLSERYVCFDERLPN
jgi:hypothetical protein